MTQISHFYNNFPQLHELLPLIVTKGEYLGLTEAGGERSNARSVLGCFWIGK